MTRVLKVLSALAIFWVLGVLMLPIAITMLIWALWRDRHKIWNIDREEYEPK